MQFNHLPREAGVYMIINTVTNETYIGSSLDVRNRCSKHLSDLQRGSHHSKYLQRSFNIHGKENFEVTCLMVCGEDEILENEEFFINRLNPKYNSIKTPTNPGRHFKTKENKYSKAQKLRWADPVYAERQRKALREALTSDEFREKQRGDALRIHRENPEIGAAHSELMKTLLEYPEYKIKQSEGTKRAMRRPEVREKMVKSKGMLDDEQVIEVLLLKRQGLLNREIAEIMGKSLYVIEDISSGRSYKHINRETLEVEWNC